MQQFLVAMMLLFSAGVHADNTAKIEKILMYEGSNLIGNVYEI
jgi:hypothetical protein